MDQAIEIVDEDLDYPIAAVLNEPEKTIVSKKKEEKYLAIMVHGFPSSRDAHDDFFGEMASIFEEFAIPSLRFDFHGCGQSEGRTRDFSLSSAQHDLGVILRWAKSHGYKNLIMIGEGLGAWLTLASLTNDVKMLLLYWPVMNPAEYAAKLFPVEDIEDLDDSAYLTFDGVNVGVRLIKELHETTVPVVPELDIPVMVQHGVQDDVVPIEQLEILKEKIVAPRVDLTSYQDGGHGLLDPRHREMIEFHIGQFLERYT